MIKFAQFLMLKKSYFQNQRGQPILFFEILLKTIDLESVLRVRLDKRTVFKLITNELTVSATKKPLGYFHLPLCLLVFSCLEAYCINAPVV